MERRYRYVLVALMIILIAGGVWYVYSCYNGQNSHEDGTLVMEERGRENGTGNGIYQSGWDDDGI